MSTDTHTTKNVVTRFAPSPTGFLHAGNYRTALFSYLFARHHGKNAAQPSRFILRIEDTDKSRSKKEYENNIVESLKWLGLDYDEFNRQSDRVQLHTDYIKKLIDSGHAYVSKETPKEPADPTEKKDRTEVIRFKNPNKKVSWNDLIRGTIEFDTTELGDFVIARSMTEPVFHLVVVVDDHEMGITHIIRGEDHISNTPRQILIYEALGLISPLYAHIPLLLAPDRSKLSKRKGALPITDYRDRGYLPEALVNYMALLGWNPNVKNTDGTDRELFVLDELVDLFDLSKIQKGGAIFNEEKLAWVNRQYLTRLSDTDFIERAETFFPEMFLGLKKTAAHSFKKILPLIREKIQTFSEIPALFGPEGELSFISPQFATSDLLPYAKESLMWRKEKNISQTIIHLKEAIRLIETLGSADTDFSAENIKNILWPYVISIPAESGGKGSVLWPLRYALSGKEKSPDPFIIADILGKNETLRRLRLASDAL
jgi:glutamyl-tRNA synthetase